MEQTTNGFPPPPPKYQLTPYDLEMIDKVTKGTYYLTCWITKKVKNFLIKSEDIYKYESYFETFERYKHKYEHKDIHQYKTEDDVKCFIDTTISIQEDNVVYEELSGQDCYVSQTDIEKLVQGNKADYLGLWNSYQVFEIWDSRKEVWTKYKNILGVVNGRGRGAKLEICTFGEHSYYSNYIKKYGAPHSSLFVLFNLNDRKSPYQLHFESGQFMDKNDDDIIKAFDKWEFCEWVLTKSKNYNRQNFVKRVDEFEFPIENEGYYKNGKKYGKFQTWTKGRLDQITTYKNDERHGEEVVYNIGGMKEVNKLMAYQSAANGKSMKGVKEFNYYEKDKLVKDLFYSDRGYLELERNFIFEDVSDRFCRNKGFDCITYHENGEVKELYKKDNNHNIQGAHISFYDNGMVESIGSYVNNNEHGKWTYFDRKGNIKKEGQYKFGHMIGTWWEKTNKGLYEYDYGNNHKIVKWNGGDCKTKNVYTTKGEFVRQEVNQEWKNWYPPYYD